MAGAGILGRTRPYSPEIEGHAGLSLRASHRVSTNGYSPLYCLREADALQSARARLPRPSSVELYQRNPRTKAETWEFWRVVSVDDPE